MTYVPSVLCVNGYTRGLKLKINGIYTKIGFAFFPPVPASNERYHFCTSENVLGTFVCGLPWQLVK